MRRDDVQAFKTIGDAPASVVRALEATATNDLGAIYKEAALAGSSSWMIQATIVGLKLERARYGSRACEQLGVEFGCKKSTVFTHAKIFKEIIRRRVDRDGDRAKFTLSEKHFYVVATESARVVGRSALEILELAEEQRRRDPSLTAQRFKRELLGEAGEQRAQEAALAKLLHRLARVPQANVKSFASSADAGEWGPILDAAAGVIAAAKSGLPGRKRVRAA